MTYYFPSLSGDYFQMKQPLRPVREFAMPLSMAHELYLSKIKNDSRKKNVVGSPKREILEQVRESSIGDECSPDAYEGDE